MTIAKMKTKALEQYYSEPKTLGENKIHQILDQGKSWDLSSTLANGGSALFPHTYLDKCGYQTAAVVHGCLNSGTDQVLVLGVLHPLTDPLLASRMKEQNHEDISKEPSWGALGPETGRNPCWQDEFSLFYFKTLWNIEVQRRRIKPPKLIERYPSLANREPEKLPGIEELQSIAKDAVVVATGDLCHHGVAYDTPHKEYKHFNEKGCSFAKEKIDIGFALLQEGKYDEYYSHCITSLNDSIDTCTVLRYLLGPLSATILDLKLVDVSTLFEGDPSPSWVAATLVEMNSV